MRRIPPDVPARYLGARRSRLVRMLVVVLALSLAGCGGEEGDPTTDPSPPEEETTRIEVFFTNLELGPEGEVHPVARETTSQDLPRAALEELLAGPTAEEASEGYVSWFSQETAGMLRELRVEDGTAHVDLDPELATTIPGASSSAGSLMLLAELDATLLQFEGITQTRYALGGDVASFYEWLQLAPPDEEGSAAPGPSAPDAEEADGSGPVTVQVFFTNTERGADDEVFGVERTVEPPAVLAGAIAQLLRGPSEQEAEAGYWSWFSQETEGMLRSVRIEEGTAYVDLDPALATTIPNASTSAGSTALLASLDATATQFPSVDVARYSFDGDADAFYQWLQRDTPS